MSLRNWTAEGRRRQTEFDKRGNYHVTTKVPLDFTFLYLKRSFSALSRYVHSFKIQYLNPHNLKRYN